MRNRKLLYGYIIQSGEIAIEPKEKIVVKRIFSSYIEGFSYQGIADMLNEDGLPYSSEDREWNKNKVKRLLENPRYIGENEYPAIITAKTFAQVQTVIQSKARKGGSKRERPALKLAAKLYCEECGQKLQRIGGNQQKPGVIYLKCLECGKLFSIADDELLAEIERQRTARKTAMAADGLKYKPSVEVMKVENELNRALEKPVNPATVIRLIQQGIAARYASCGNRTEAKSLNVVRININKEETINAHFE